jgi:glutathione synthase/RimK-type ligase-like ATP-grasp enzyme
MPTDKFVIFGPSTHPNRTIISYHWQKETQVIYANNELVSDADVVWFRKPQYLSDRDFPVEKKFQSFLSQNYKSSITWLYDLIPNSFWVSNPRNIMRGNNKLYQMQIAGSLDMRMPDTLVTNNASEVRKFRKLYGNIVVKPLAPEAVKSGKSVYFMYTELVERKEKLNLEGIEISPMIFQQAITGIDVRVTVIGDQIFATEIRKKGTLKNEVDWRVGITDGRKLYYRATVLPEYLQMQCFALVKEMGLEFGAIDFIIDPDNNYWLLEINPNGQWGFIEEQTGQPLSQAMAKLFRSRV